MLGVGPRKKGRRGAGFSGSQDSPTLAHRKQRLQRLLLAGAFAVLVASITEFPTLNNPAGYYDIDAEAVASRTVRANFAFESEDLEATREQRDLAAAQVPATYSVDLERVRNQKLTLQQRIFTLRERSAEVDNAIKQALLASTSAEADAAIVERVVNELAATWKQDPLFEGYPEAPLLATWIMPRLDSLPKREFAPATEGAAADTPRPVTGLAEEEGRTLAFANQEVLTPLALDSLEYVLLAGVRQSGASGQQQESAQRIQILRGQVAGDLKTGEELNYADIPDLNESRTRLRARIAEKARELESRDPNQTVNWEQVQNAAFELAKTAVTDTLFFNKVITEGNRELARANVEPVMKSIDNNQILQRDGDKWTQQARADVKTYWEILEDGQTRTRSVVNPLLANALFCGLLLLGLLKAIPMVSQKRMDVHQAINVILLVVCGTLVLGRVIAYFEPEGLLVPIMGSAMLLAILTNARMAFMASLIMAVLLSIQYGQDWQLLVVGVAMSFGGISGLYKVRRRGDMASAAIKGTGVGLATVLAITLATDAPFSLTTFYMLAKVGLNGVACLFLVPGLLSPLERIFGITTDIQLLEYSDLNNEILSRLAIEVPATYAHSLMLGQLAEAASDAIGANGLLARVSAYYHDIGKMRRPEYFSENQTGFNIHDELSPRLSSRAIASHVTEGVEIAREYHLPKPIIDGILEHHGTTLISYFYQQALEHQKHGDVREEDFRYPGPRPQSRETAILMICDATESGVRSIKNPNEERIREFIDKIIQARADDRQFDQCDLTLRDLDVIQNVLVTRLLTSLHTRIAYPDKPSDRTGNVIKISGGRER